jgi:hypothetical protein
MVLAMEKEQGKGFMEKEVMDDLLNQAKQQYDWIK